MGKVAAILVGVMLLLAGCSVVDERAEYHDQMAEIHQRLYTQMDRTLLNFEKALNGEDKEAEFEDSFYKADEVLADLEEIEPISEFEEEHKYYVNFVGFTLATIGAIWQDDVAKYDEALAKAKEYQIKSQTLINFILEGE